MDFIRKVAQLDLQLSYTPTEFTDSDLNKLLKVNYYKLGILLDLDCPDGEKIFQWVDS